MAAWLPATPCVFFFSSRRRHTRFDCDWSSDVCSSDLHQYAVLANELAGNTGAAPYFVDTTAVGAGTNWQDAIFESAPTMSYDVAATGRSEERRVGKECRSRWSPYH